MRLHDLFYKFMSEYETELSTAKLREQIQTDVYKVKGSVGAGRWTDVPWIAVFDKRITTSAQKGVYIVYLLNKDTKELFLTLNQGATDIAQGGDGSGKLACTG